MRRQWVTVGHRPAASIPTTAPAAFRDRDALRHCVACRRLRAAEAPRQALSGRPAFVGGRAPAQTPSERGLGVSRLRPFCTIRRAPYGDAQCAHHASGECADRLARVACELASGVWIPPHEPRARASGRGSGAERSLERRLPSAPSTYPSGAVLGKGAAHRIVCSYLQGSRARPSHYSPRRRRRSLSDAWQRGTDHTVALARILCMLRQCVRLSPPSAGFARKLGRSCRAPRRNSHDSCSSLLRSMFVISVGIHEFA